MKRKIIALCAVGSLAISAGGCAPTTVRSELYFGLTRHDGPAITAKEWQDFVDREITPRFPDGLTVVHADGQWREQSGTVTKEPSRIVIIVHPGTAKQSRKLDEIRAAYKKQFSQEAVLEVDEAAEMKL